MEQDPQPFYERGTGNGNEQPLLRPNSKERLLPRSEVQPISPEAGTSGKSFEDLVHEALEEELKFERDPATRNQASQRADEILAEFAEAKSAREQAGSKLDQDSNSKLPPDLAEQLGISNSGSKQPAPLHGSAANLGVLDLVMAIVITVLLIIVILLLVF